MEPKKFKEIFQITADGIVVSGESFSLTRDEMTQLWLDIGEAIGVIVDYDEEVDGVIQ